MTGSASDRRARSDGPDSTTGASATRPRTAAAAFGVVVFVGSVVPVPTASSGGAPGGAIGGLVDGAFDLIVGALPAGLGLTAPFHFVGYAVLAALFVRAANRERRGVAVAAAMAVAAATAFGFGIELVQAPIPWRSFAWTDAALNAAGAVVGAVTGAVAGPVAARTSTR
ncbi:VanZ family protein [Halorubrum sp. CBA1229]|nr:VanZ family protein [Halorubrum sp. CBA1229]